MCTKHVLVPLADLGTCRGSSVPQLCHCSVTAARAAHRAICTGLWSAGSPLALSAAQGPHSRVDPENRSKVQYTRPPGRNPATMPVFRVTGLGAFRCPYAVCRISEQILIFKQICKNPHVDVNIFLVFLIEVYTCKGQFLFFLRIVLRLLQSSLLSLWWLFCLFGFGFWYSEFLNIHSL